ncbi:ISNCY family transposase [Vibrio fluvialis]|nr:ISNCY family transposase [Vibrio fluvialis]MBY7942448.1 ISNCY family transposase [Vibrio fluvialis]MBY8169460.1 ISNCY family transposase [Vibrio fluvialis]MBY8259314.1 ISNCY family transposase [Vibrio fluvialis]MBY8267715.1 ISNCY family transposase [Vibrio fluvialis]
MSDRDINRFKVLQDVRERRLRQVDAAEILNLTPRQVRRLLVQLSQYGASSLVHGARGRPSNRRYPEDFRADVLNIVRSQYADFSPTFACEKLSEQHYLTLSVETLRQWMIADGLWVPHSQRRPRVYQPRYRRDCLGELIQIDGSHHNWFEGRSPKCCLLVYIDDATGRLMNLRFSETESAFDYMMATREYIDEHGKPVAFYSDRHAIFHSSNKQAVESKNPTQYGRMLHDLGIELICANSSQAKGRVERANQTLQDRLVKELRLHHIDNIEEANVWLPYFIADFNQRFAKPANYPKDMHRPVRESKEELDDIFSWQDTRKLSKSLTFQYDKVVYLLENTEENSRLVNEVVKIFDYPDGSISIRYGTRSLNFKTFDKLQKIDQGKVVDNKRLGQVLKFAQQKQEEFEKNQTRERSKSSPCRKAQKRAVAQRRSLNPILTEPEIFEASQSRKA